MYLRAVRLKGFKSFPLQTELVFEPGIAVIIGPNGSGKSNIADAVMWVLGEQSPTSIRGSSMQDMIFAGSDGRRAGGSAEVELTFDNSDGALSLPTPEVSIGRRVRRDGEATYFINRSPCRLTDVIESVAEIGLGKEMHSIVGQGRVESLLAARPVDRRALIEEAAGLGRYKRRRERAELKLREVARNLERARESEHEAAQRLAPLRRQANAAELSRTIELELSEIEARLLAAELEEADRLADAERAVLDETLAARASVEDQLREAAAGRRAEDARFARELEERERRRQRAVRARFLTDRLDSCARLTVQRGALLEEVERAAHAEAERLRAELALAGGRPESEADSEDFSDVEARLAVTLAAAESGHAAAAHELALTRGELSKVSAERDRLSSERDNVVARAQRLRARLVELDEAVARASAEVERARDDEQTRRAALVPGSDSFEAARAAETQAADAKGTLRAAEERLQGIAAEARTLELEIEHLTAGMRDADDVAAAVVAVTDGFPGAAVLQRVVACEPGYEKALAAVLARNPGAIAVPPSQDGWSLLAALRRSGITLAHLLLPTRRGQVATFPGAAPLLDKVTVDADGLEEFLSSVVVVDDLRGVPEDFAGLAVTRDGAYYRPGTGELGLAAGVAAAVSLERRSRVGELERRLAAARARELREQPAVGRLREEAAVADEARSELEAALSATRAEGRRVGAQRRAVEDELDRLVAVLGQTERAHAAVQDEAAAVRSDAQALEAREMELRSQVEELAPTLAKAEATAASAEERHEAALSAVTVARVEREAHLARRRPPSGARRSPARPPCDARHLSGACRRAGGRSFEGAGAGRAPADPGGGGRRTTGTRGVAAPGRARGRAAPGGRGARRAPRRGRGRADASRDAARRAGRAPGRHRRTL